MNGCVDGVYRFSCLCCLRSGPVIELTLIRGGPPCPFVVKKSMYVSQSKFPLPTGRGSVRPGWHESRKGTYKREVKLRQRINEIISFKKGILWE